ncbi:hypothetical protein [Streptomyces sp. NPDC046909]|uniref:hypothetical protein n=1 Tax=Streptomyces sp. NPDC046909 TaxID=3155617 RepID=UPI0033DB22D2
MHRQPHTHAPATRPRNATRRPRTAWYLLPALLLATAVACLGLAAFEAYRGALGSAHPAVTSFAHSVLGSLKDVTTYGDGNPAPPHSHAQVEHHASGETSPGTTSFTLLKVAAASALASLIGFASVASARTWSQQRHRPKSPFTH